MKTAFSFFILIFLALACSKNEPAPGLSADFVDYGAKRPVIKGINATITPNKSPAFANFYFSLEGFATEYEWKFDDNTISTEKIASYTYLKPGNYVVKLKVKGPAGVDSSSRTINIGQDPNLVAYFPFDNGEVKDESVYKNRGLTQNISVTTDRFIQPAKAFKFGGVDNPSRVHLFTSPSFQFSNTLCISMWLRVDGMKGHNGNTLLPFSPNGVQALFNKDVWTYRLGPNTVADCFRGYINFATQDRMQLTMLSPTGTYSATGWQEGLTVVTTTDIVQNPLGKWFHFVYQVGNGRAQLYFNGKLQKEQNQPAVGYAFSNTRDLFLGGLGSLADTPSTPVVFAFNGAMDEVRFYNRLLSEAEIAALSR